MIFVLSLSGGAPARRPPRTGCAGAPRRAAAPALDALYNLAVAGLRRRGVKLLLRLCFGTFNGRPRTARSYRTLFPGVLAADCDQFVLECAGREMREAGLWRELAIDRELGAGVVDVKSFYPESVEPVADRIRGLLTAVPPEKLWLNPDCGFNHTARWLCVEKLHALAAGAARVRQEVAGVASPAGAGAGSAAPAGFNGSARPGAAQG